MSSSKIARDTTWYERLSNQDLDSHNHNHTPPTSTSIRHQGPSSSASSASSSASSASSASTALRSAVRRRRPEPSRPSALSAMSLVGLKHLFLRQTVTPVPIHSKTEAPQTSSSDSDVADVESQDSKTEKVNQKKGFRVDARVISDATIGLSDGLTVPFALTAGLSALGNTKVVIYGGFAELIAGAISMGLGGYLGAKSEAASYRAQRDEAQRLIATDPQTVMADITEVFEPYRLPKRTLDDLTTHLSNSPRLVDFVMQFQHCTEQPASSRAVTSAITIAVGYFLGGLLPLVPYFCVGREQVYEGLYISIGVMVVALFVFGYVKTCVVVGWDGGRNIRSGCFGGIQMVVVGSAAAGAAMGLVRLFNRDESGYDIDSS